MSNDTQRGQRRGDPCRHTEHAISADGYVGRYWDGPTVGLGGSWEQCPNQPSYGALARAEAMEAGYADWVNVTSWDPVKRAEVAR